MSTSLLSSFLSLDSAVRATRRSVVRRAITPLCALALLSGAAACDDNSEVPSGPLLPDAGALTSSDGAVLVAPQFDGSIAVTVDGGGTPTTPVIGTGSAWCKAKAVIDARCVTCHDGKGTSGSPFGLTSFDDVSKDSPTKAGTKISARIGVRVHPEKSSAESLGVMPPGKPLAAEELAAIDAWLAAGAVSGDNPSCAGAPVVPPVTEAPWPPAECDAVYRITAHGSAGLKDPYVVPAGQEIHPQVYVDAPWGTEKVQAIQFKPVTDNKKVLHHWIMYSAQGAFLTGWAPGDDERSPFPPDVGMEMPTGTRSMRLDMHYFNTTGTTQELDMSGLEVCIVKGAKLRKYSAAVTMALTSIGGINGLAPANTTNYANTATCNVVTKEPVHLLTASPHAHTYARHMKFVLKHKDGSPDTIMHDADFMFGEQHSYPLNPQVIINTGDVITTTCTYTNTTNKNITFGESTTNEMCFNFAVYYPKGAFSCGGAGGVVGGGAGGLFGGT